jgi:hypothetical protein
MSTINGQARPLPLPISKSQRKAVLMRLARKAGWRGTSYRKAKKFDQALTRADRLAKRGMSEWDNDSIVRRVRRKVARLIKRGGK